LPAAPFTPAAPGPQQPDPYLDYGRFLTPEGGVLIAYKDYDERLRQILKRLVVWAAATGFAGWLLLIHSPLHAQWINAGLFLIMAVANAVIAGKKVETYRTVEIRPDCMILEGRDLFWLRFMENGLPAFKPDEDGNQVLSGIYGTRHIEYLTARRFDDYDRTPEVFAAHLQQAMEQLWGPALGLDTRRSSPPRQK
jgi:hypothetical protein